jgi:hypothetical protein
MPQGARREHAVGLVNQVAGLVAVLGLAGCAPSPRPAPAEAAPSVRFVCVEGCESFKTVRPGETPPPCCGAPMQPD